MPGVLNLTDVLQLVVNSLNQRPLAEHQFIPEPHEPILHILADFGQECEALRKEDIVQGLGNIPPVAKELTKQPLGERGHRFSVVNMPWCQAKGQEFSLVIDHQMELEAVEPAYRRLAPCGPTGKDPVGLNPAIMT